MLLARRAAGHRRLGRRALRTDRSSAARVASVPDITARSRRRGVDRPHRPAPRQADGPRPRPPSALNPRYRFEQFIIGDGNRLAHAAALAVAELPGQAYNPLFLHAPPGLGKTHLLHAIGNYVPAFGGGAIVRYTTAEAFTNHFIAALGSRVASSTSSTPTATPTCC